MRRVDPAWLVIARWARAGVGRSANVLVGERDLQVVGETGLTAITV
jgi:hypothetical protein